VAVAVKDTLPLPSVLGVAVTVRFAGAVSVLVVLFFLQLALMKATDKNNTVIILQMLGFILICF
jgi:hypothetical protein